MYPSLFITLLSVVLVKGELETIRIQHRVVDPTLAVPAWSTLGTVSLPPLHSVSSLGSPALFIPSDTALHDIAQFAQSVEHTTQGAMYQVALERPGITDDLWPTSVVKTCYLPGSTSAHLTIHFSSSGLPFAIDHFVSPVPHDGSCPPPHTKPTLVHNTTITLMSPRHPPRHVFCLTFSNHFLYAIRPELRTPPPLTAEGEPMAPAPEKSFLQKYWIYMVVILGVLLISGPVEEPAGNGGGQGGR